MNFPHPLRAPKLYRMALAFAAVVCAPAGDLSSIAMAGKGGKGGGGDQDLPVCITMGGTGNLTGDGSEYCASTRRITAFVGRNRSITFELQSNQSRTLLLTLGERLADDTYDEPNDGIVDVDPDPNNDEGVVNQLTPGTWGDNHPIPMLPVGGVTGKLEVAYEVNVLRMGETVDDEPNPNYRNARFTFRDDSGQEWRLLWGPHPTPGGSQATNPTAPAVEIMRRVDGNGNLINEWDVETLTETVRGPVPAATAFLKRLNRNGPGDYWGAFNVTFSYAAIEEK